MRQMASEVKKRLDAVDMVGRSLTLKIMKRDPSAPIEPQEICSHHYAMISLVVDGNVVPQPWDLRPIQQARSHRFPWGQSDKRCTDNWRPCVADAEVVQFRPEGGIGIQIQKLESASGLTFAPKGQASYLSIPKP